jgi:ribosomal protein L20A (L18A)
MNGLLRAAKLSAYKDVDSILEEFRAMEKSIRDTKRQEAFEKMYL